MSVLMKCGHSRHCKRKRRAQTRGKIVREKLILVREKSVKSQGVSFQTKTGHPDNSYELKLGQLIEHNE